MKNVVSYPLFVILIASMFPAGLLAAEKPSLEKGRLLFNSRSLAGATSGKSCAECHSESTGFGLSVERPETRCEFS